MPSVILTSPPIPEGGGYSAASQRWGTVFNRCAKGPFYIDISLVDRDASNEFLTFSLEGIELFNSRVSEFSLRLSVIDVNAGCKFATRSSISETLAALKVEDLPWSPIMSSFGQSIIPYIETASIKCSSTGKCASKQTIVINEPALLAREGLGLLIEVIGRDEFSLVRLGWVFLSLSGDVLKTHHLPLYRYLFLAPTESDSSIVQKNTEISTHCPLGAYEFGAGYRHYADGAIYFRLGECREMPPLQIDGNKLARDPSRKSLVPPLPAEIKPLLLPPLVTGPYPRLIQCLPTREFHSMIPKNGGISRIAFSPSGELLALGERVGSAWELRVIDLESKTVGYSHLKLSGILTDLCWADNSTLLSAGTDGMVRVWGVGASEVTSKMGSRGQLASPFSLNLLATLPHAGPVTSVRSFGTQGGFVSTCPKGLSIWREGELTAGILPPADTGNFLCVRVLANPDDSKKGFRGSFVGTALEPYSKGLPDLPIVTKIDSYKFLVSTSNGFIVICDESGALASVGVPEIPASTPIHSFEIVTDSLKAGLVSTSALTAAALLLLFSKDSIIRTAALSNLEGGPVRVLSEFKGASMTGKDIRGNITPDGRFVFSGSECGRLFVWEAATGKRVNQPKCQPYDISMPFPILDVQWSPAHRLVGITSYAERDHFCSPLVLLAVDSSEGKATPDTGFATPKLKIEEPDQSRAGALLREIRHSVIQSLAAEGLKDL